MAGVDLDPRSPLCVPDLSGQLKDHIIRCEECEGTGQVDPGFVPEEQCGYCKLDDFPMCCEACDPCDDCEGEGEIRFWCWYAEDRGMCTNCGEHEVLCASADNSYVCLPCMLRWHKEKCGCALWKEAESFILGD